MNTNRLKRKGKQAGAFVASRFNAGPKKSDNTLKWMVGHWIHWQKYAMLMILFTGLYLAVLNPINMKPVGWWGFILGAVATHIVQGLPKTIVGDAQ